MSFKKGFRAAKRTVDLVRIAASSRKVLRSEGEAKEAAKRALANLLADARGVPMKVGQFLSTLPENEAFETLTASVEPRPLSEMVGVLEEQLGVPVASVFASIEESEAAASLGQVHHATLLDGTEVAVKVCYPEIGDAVATELRIAGLMPGVGPGKKWGFDLDGYKHAIRSNMERELDYASEAERQHRYAEGCQIEGLITPRVYAEHCGKGALVQGWEWGTPLSSAASWETGDRRQLGEILAGALFKSLFCHGEVHCDPNLGNLFIRKDPADRPEVVLLDYGCMTRIDERAQLALLKLILGSIGDDDTDPLACFGEMGFDVEKLAPIADILPALCKILFEPFQESGPFSPKYWHVSDRSTALLGDLRWWFRSAGPPELFLLMRGFAGLLQHLDILKIIISWRQVLFDSVGPETIARARAFEPAPPSEADGRRVRSFDTIAKFLNVRVTENGAQVVRVTMPATQIVYLEDLIPEDVLEKVAESGIDVREIREQACAAGVAPRELFNVQNGSRDYRVWLE